MPISRLSSERNSSEPDDEEISTSDESATETPNDHSKRAIKIRDDPSEHADSPALLLSSDASEVRLDTYERPTGEAESEADADAEDSDGWGSELEPDEYTITELINTINCNKIALPDEAEVRDFEVPGDDKEDTSAAGYEFVKTRVDVDKIMNSFRETQWPLDLATGNRIDPALKLAKKANISQKREEVENLGEHQRKDWVTDEMKGKGIERVNDGEGNRKEVDVKAPETDEEWKDEEQVKKPEYAEVLKQGREGASSPSVYSQ